MPACQLAAWAVTSLVISINLFLLFDFAQSHLPPTLPIHICLAAAAVAYLTFTAYLGVGPTAAERMWGTAFRRWGGRENKTVLKTIVGIAVTTNSIIVRGVCVAVITDMITASIIVSVVTNIDRSITNNQ